MQPGQNVLKSLVAVRECDPLPNRCLDRDTRTANVRHRQLSPPTALFPCVQGKHENRDLYTPWIQLEAE